ncbi:MAG: DUF2237 domain-containing protein [Phycisphaeraceae bacterium]|nr:hypothetical protein [Phycisphaerae bacterium]MCP3858501.1 DUF2237 domain-containing protein [Phycisphaeraceae bacterium]MAC76023.1 hypothetical protein [Phycisphaerae bacterium]MCP4012733.1 DUF2237 domain-containing protein [Phycisphaeraceae bacterium]MCP4068256.1 DUF2237 domain-containing protein [Phycisphaeraceae bacterium]
MIRSADSARADAVDRNVLGGELKPCSIEPLTGYYRDGCCRSGPDDQGIHSVCSLMTAEFLEFSKAAGNDLSTPRPEWGFDGLNPGDRWCLCAARWLEADDAGVSPQVFLAATHARTLDVVPIERLRARALDG